MKTSPAQRDPKNWYRMEDQTPTPGQTCKIVGAWDPAICADEWVFNELRKGFRSTDDSGFIATHGVTHWLPLTEYEKLK